MHPTPGTEMTPATPHRLPTMSDVARHVGVSRQLVSLVMRNAPGPSTETRERVLSAASHLGYRANASARLLRQKRTYLLGALFSMRNPYESHLVEQLFVGAAAHRYGVVLGPVTESRPATAVAEELLEQRVEALVGFLPTDWTDDVQRLATSVPVVWLGGPVEGFDNVHIDDGAGMRVAVEHLTGLGHRRITHVRADDGLAGHERAVAYVRAMQSAGLGTEVDTVGAGFFEEDGATAARQLLRRDDLPTAVVCASDQSAAGLTAVLQAAGVRTPQDVSVVGWDDSHVARLSYLDLTSVRQEIGQTAAAAVDLAIRRLDDPTAPVRSVLTPARLVVRSSTGPARVH